MWKVEKKASAVIAEGFQHKAKYALFRRSPEFLDGALVEGEKRIKIKM